MNRTLKLTSAATAAIPRVIMITLTCIYAFSGLFGHDPWKNDDAQGFGSMWMVAHGNLHDIVFPHISGRDILVGPPLPYWIGGLSIQILGSTIGAVNAARLVSGLCFIAAALLIWYATYLLGRRSEVQPMAFAFGGQPSPTAFGRTIADGALLIFIACIGLAIKVHEASPLLLELFGICLLIFGMTRSLGKSIQGGAMIGLALGVIALSGSLTGALMLCVGSVMSLTLGQVKISRVGLCVLVLCFGLMLSIWPFTWYWTGASSDHIHQAIDVWLGPFALHKISSLGVLSDLATDFWTSTWPVWPLFFWSVYVCSKSDRTIWRSPHVFIPLCVCGSQFIPLLFSIDLNEHTLLLLTPPMSILGAFGLPFLRRGLISFIDWLAMLSFTALAIFIWLIWFAKLTGYPAATADNIQRFIPGFIAHFDLLDLIFALIITLIWIFIVRWRVSRAPREIWRCLVISASGTTLMWVLMMTLWLPTINYAKTYQIVAQHFAQALPKNARCIDSRFLGDAQLASFVFFTQLPLQDDESCDYMLTHNQEEAKSSARLNHQRLKMIWEDRRDSDRDERLRLYQILENK